MIEAYKSKNNWGYDTFTIKMDEGAFEILFAPNGDLYWRYLCEENILDAPERKEFTITKENYFIYGLFFDLYRSIKQNKIYFDIEESDCFHVKGENKLFKNGVIDWYSDEFPDDIASRLIIKKEEESFKLTFIKSKEDYDGIFMTYSIRFRNSGSRYHPYNIVFMNMYNKLKKHDFDNHQIHIEEYLYNQKVKKKVKK